MDRVEEPTDDDEVSFAPTPSPDEARARLAALRGKPLDAPSRLVTDDAPAVEPEVVTSPAPTAAETIGIGIPVSFRPQPETVSISLPADQMALLLDLLNRPQQKAEAQRAAAALKQADKPLFKVKKVRITTRIDADVLEAFKATGPGYQTLMNDVLRANMPGS